MEVEDRSNVKLTEMLAREVQLAALARLHCYVQARPLGFPVSYIACDTLIPASVDHAAHRCHARELSDRWVVIDCRLSHPKRLGPTMKVGPSAL
jgi:hypothetical protein